MKYDNGREYNNRSFQNFFHTNGIQIRFSYPYTSQQNGKAEHSIRTINNAISTFSLKLKCLHSFGLKLFTWVFTPSIFIQLLLFPKNLH